MEIITSVLEKYFENANYPVHIGINIEPPYTSDLSVTAGKPGDNGSLRIFLSYKDLSEILVVNNILDSKSLLNAERDAPTKDYKKDQKMNDLVYGTLQKYIYQMLKANINKEFFPEITPLPKHKDTFWPRIMSI